MFNFQRRRGHDLNRPPQQISVRATKLIAISLLSALMNTVPSLAEEAPALPSVTVAIVAQSEVIGRVPMSGTLVARNEILIYPQVSGYSIERLHYDIGDWVREGDILAELNSQILTAQFEQAKALHSSSIALVRQAFSQIASADASVTQASAVLERTESLQTRGTTTQSVLDQAIAADHTAQAGRRSALDSIAIAKANLQQTDAQLEIARLNLEHATIVSPADGLISTRDGQVGAIASSDGEPIFRLVANGEIEIEAEIIETALGQIETGDTVQMVIAGIGQTDGEVRLIAPIVDPVTRLGTVRIATKDSARLRSGLFAGGWIITDQRMSLTVPATAVLSDINGTYVLSVSDGVLAKTPVTAGLLWQTRREIIDGLSAGDVVVAKAGAFFAHGDRIIPVAETDVIAKRDAE